MDITDERADNKSTRPGPVDRMNKEWTRLGSYLTLEPVIYRELQPLALSKQGLYVNDEKLICFSCQKTTGVWDFRGPRTDCLHEENCQVTDNISIKIPPENICNMIRTQLHEEYCTKGTWSDMDLRDSGSTLRSNAEPQLQTASPAPPPTNIAITTTSARISEPVKPPAVPLLESSKANPQYNTVSARLTTFQTWSQTAPVSAKAIAEAGFIYLNVDDRVQCVFCKGILREWEDGDIPMDEHAKYFPKCEFVVQRNASSIPPLDHNIVNIVRSTPSLYTNIVKPNVQNISYLSKPTGITSTRSSPDSQTKYNTVPSRLGTFKSWPHSTITPHSLSLAGLYSTGKGDTVKCFKCGVTLESWLPTDDPSTRHAKNSPSCEYITKIKGQDFVQHEYCGTEAMSMLPRTGNVQQNETINNKETCSLPTGDDHNTDPQTLKMENDKLKDEKLCIVCFDAPKEMLILPCAHLSVCSNCVVPLKKCPICRTVIKGTVKTFPS